jgi:hypothetical protein
VAAPSNGVGSESKAIPLEGRTVFLLLGGGRRRGENTGKRLREEERMRRKRKTEAETTRADGATDGGHGEKP